MTAASRTSSTLRPSASRFTGSARRAPIGACPRESDLNPGKFNCPHCKGFKQYGICSHVLAINHILMAINLRRELMEIGKSTMKKN